MRTVRARIFLTQGLDPLEMWREVREEFANIPPRPEKPTNGQGVGSLMGLCKIARMRVSSEQYGHS